MTGMEFDLQSENPSNFIGDGMSGAGSGSVKGGRNCLPAPIRTGEFGNGLAM